MHSRLTLGAKMVGMQATRKAKKPNLPHRLTTDRARPSLRHQSPVDFNQHAATLHPLLRRAEMIVPLCDALFVTT
jgi:hypothetical protein